MRGVTLVEVVVAMLIVGLLAGLTAAAIPSLSRPRVEAWKAAVTHARDSAIRNGQTVVFEGDSGQRALLLPDGRVIGRGFNVLTGEPLRARQ